VPTRNPHPINEICSSTRAHHLYSMANFAEIFQLHSCEVSYSNCGGCADAVSDGRDRGDLVLFGSDGANLTN
jgi:hypothetical protein